MSPKLIKTLKALFPIIAALSVYFWVYRIEPNKPVHRNHSTNTEFKAIPIEGFQTNK